MAYTPSLADLQAPAPSAQAPVAAGYTPSLTDLQPTSGPSSQPTGQPLSQPQDDSGSIGSYAKAATAGLSNFGADVGQAAASTATYLPTALMQHLGIISPETAHDVSKSIQSGADAFRTQGDINSSDPFEKAAGQHPTLTKGINLAGDAMTAFKAMGLISEAGGAATAAAGKIAGVVTRAASQGLLGQAMTSNPDDKSASFALNAALSPGFDLAGKIVSTVGTKIGAVDKIKDVLSWANKQLGGVTTDEKAGGSIANVYGATKAVVNKWYDTVKDSFFSQEDQGLTYQLGAKLHNFIYSSGDTLSSVQKSVLSDASQELSKAGSHADTLKTLQSLGNQYSKFSGINASDSVYAFYKGAQQDLRDIITKAATREGNGQAMDRANLIHERMIRPMQELGADDISVAVEKYGIGSDEVKQATNNILNKYIDNKGVGKITELLNSMDSTGSNLVSSHIVKTLFDRVGDMNFDFGKATTQLNQYISKYDKILSEPAMNTLKGVQTLIKQAGTSLQKTGSASTYASHLIGASLGGAVGYHMGGAVGGEAGVIAGVAGGPMILQFARQLMSTTAGQGILRALGEPGPKTKAASDLIKAMSVMKISSTVNKGQ